MDSGVREDCRTRGAQIKIERRLRILIGLTRPRSKSKREVLIAAGSVILHEIYFESLGGHGDNPLK